MDYLYNFGNHVFDSIKFSKLSFKNDNKTPTISRTGIANATAATISGNNSCGSATITFNADPVTGKVCEITFSETLGRSPNILITSNSTTNINLSVTAVTTGKFQVNVNGTVTGVREISFNYLVIS